MNNMNEEYNKLWRFLSDNIPDRNLASKIADYVEEEMLNDTISESELDCRLDEAYEEGFREGQSDIRYDIICKAESQLDKLKEDLINEINDLNFDFD